MPNRRKQIIDILNREFVGPNPLPGQTQDNGEEILYYSNPSDRYISGVLYTPKTKRSEFFEIHDSEKSRQVEELLSDDSEPINYDPNVEDENSDEVDFSGDLADEVINASNEFKQSAMSISFKPDELSCVKLSISGAQYRLSKESSGYVYYRQPINYTINVNKLHINIPFSIPLEHTYGIDLAIVLMKRNGRNEEDTFYTASLLNNTCHKEGYGTTELYLFQSKINIESSARFLPISSFRRITTDSDYCSNQLLYRNKMTYAIGHGCSVIWKESDNVQEIESSFLPSYEILANDFIHPKIEHLEFDMIEFSELSITPDIRFKKLNDLLICYRDWIISTFTAEKINKLGELKTTALEHKEKCETCLKRMTVGLDLLRDYPLYAKAFSLMNKAMLLQQIHYKTPLSNLDFNKNDLHYHSNNRIPVINNPDTWHGDPKRYGKWRPFQIAFILMNLDGISDRSSDDRGLVDLIWFSTGGGKTEAYLGLTAYTIFLRRLKKPQDAGTTVIMRYTLRLLSSQQFERAASLICACEYIRNEIPVELGKTRITSGFWVGSKTTPNSEADAKTALSYLHKNTRHNPFIITKCPWCGSILGPIGDSSDIIGYKIKEGKFQFICENPECDFSAENGNSLPLTIVDEDIYNNPPTLVIGTVDKFALLPWKPQAKSIFGFSNCHNFSKPELIIQDELHLISGPLGSIVGHYETLISELCVDSEGVRPKIIASTATISHAAEQCKALYAVPASSVIQFPPPGLDYNDSFFSIEALDKPGRMYLGVMAPGATSSAVASIRLYTTLLFASKEIEVKKEADRDPYWTIMGYYNSLRELGVASTWVHADIPEKLKPISLRSHRKDPGATIQKRFVGNCIELASRKSSSDITNAMKQLSISYGDEKSNGEPVGICLATNMISVGLDIGRLGLMVIAGQPKTASEYIQASSRVGRETGSPGLVITLLSPSKPRDKSHFEHFQEFHSKIYSFVEPTSITPFSEQVQARALHAILVGYLRLIVGFEDNPPVTISEEQIDRFIKIMENRVNAIIPEEIFATRKLIDKRRKQLENWRYSEYDSDEGSLLTRAGTTKSINSIETSWETLMSMRSVDQTCLLRQIGYNVEEDNHE